MPHSPESPSCWPAHGRFAQQLVMRCLRPLHFVHPGHGVVPVQRGQLYQRRRTGARLSTGIRQTRRHEIEIVDLGALAPMAEPVPELQENQPQVALHRRGRSAQPRIKNGAHGAENRGCPASTSTLAARPAARVPPPAAITSTTTVDRVWCGSAAPRGGFQVEIASSTCGCNRTRGRRGPGPGAACI